MTSHNNIPSKERVQWLIVASFASPSVRPSILSFVPWLDGSLVSLFVCLLTLFCGEGCLILRSLFVLSLVRWIVRSFVRWVDLQLVRLFVCLLVC